MIHGPIAELGPQFAIPLELTGNVYLCVNPFFYNSLSMFAAAKDALYDQEHGGDPGVIYNMVTNKPVFFSLDYTNWRGVRSTRKVLPQQIAYMESEYHPGGPQLMLVALDIEKNSVRHFPLNAIHSWDVVF